MSNFFDRLFKRRRGQVSNDRTVVTDLMLDAATLDDYASNYDQWLVNVDAHRTHEETELFYKNLTRLTERHQIPKNSFSFRISGSKNRADVVCQVLRARGFKDTEIIESDIDHYSTLREPDATYSRIGLIFKVFPVAGLQYHIKESDNIWNQVYVGKEVSLIAEPNNPHDAAAVKIIFEKEDGTPTLLGYIPRTDNYEIALLLQSGYNNALSARIEFYSPGASYHSRLKIAVYLKPFKTLTV